MGSVKCYQAREHYKKLRMATIVVQSYARGMKARVQLRMLKLEKRRNLAATTIAAHWRGHHTRVEYRKFFRAHAGKLIAKFMEKYFRTGVKSTESDWTQSNVKLCRTNCSHQHSSKIKKLHTQLPWCRSSLVIMSTSPQILNGLKSRRLKAARYYLLMRASRYIEVTENLSA